MSIIDGLNTAVGALTGNRVGGSPTPRATGLPLAGTGGASTPNGRIGTIFDTTFKATFSDVTSQAVNGAWDDPTLRLEETAAVARLAAARAQLESATTTAPAAGNLVPGGGGANAAPTVNGSAAAGAGQFISEQRGVLAIHVRQSTSRLDKISHDMSVKYPEAAKLASASTGTWDPEAFVPQDEAQAHAFAQRMAVDVVESSARLELIQTQLEAATFEARTTGSPEAKALTASLQGDMERQLAYVEKLARIVQSGSNGKLAALGAEALAGNTARGADERSVGEFAGGLHGMDDETVKTIVGASEVGVEIGGEHATEATRAQATSALDTVADTLATWTWQHRENLRESRAEYKRDAAARRRADDKRDETRHAERKQERREADERFSAKRHEHRQVAEQVAQQHIAERRGDFNAYLQQLAARTQQQRASA